MEQNGYVTEINNGIAKVRVDRQSSCGGHCVSCKGCPSNAVIVECIAPDNIAVGDTVKLCMPKGKFFKNAFWGYGFTTILTITGAVLGYLADNSDSASVLGAATGLVIGLLIVKILFKKNKIEITAKK